ncbi:MAG TPA: MltA domain-containing protein [Sphingomicrobium sp.]|nr:MltA domain-containing protein [Sphingomicrobium sp.]
MSGLLRAVSLASLLFLSACVSRPVAPPQPQQPPVQPVRPTPQPPKPPPPANAVQAGVRLVPPMALEERFAAKALDAFKVSCPSVTRRNDKSGLANPADWAGVCSAAKSVPPGGAASFFYNAFDWVRVGDGKAFATGYFEPEIAASPVRAPGYTVPIYAVPSDLTRCYGAEGKGRGRVDHQGQCVLYYSRAEIEDGALANRGLEIAWAADPIELFFLHIQGSGRLRFPDGTIERIGYADQNGRDYVAIGRLLRERGVLPPGGASMQSIVAWMRANPDQARALMRENLSYIFFKELKGPGPLGAMGLPVTPRASVAADPNFIPLGAPVLLMLDRPEAWGMWVAQDTGGAIKGANRVDTFWGAGEEARHIAGGMSASGQALILLPKGSAARALARP